MSAAWVRSPAGPDLRPGRVGLPGDLCHCPHRGHTISGRLAMHGKDGVTIHGARQAFSWAAGHGPEALTDCEYVDFAPSEELEAVVRHLRGG